MLFSCICSLTLPEQKQTKFLYEFPWGGALLALNLILAVPKICAFKVCLIFFILFFSFFFGTLFEIAITHACFDGLP